jgi:hypothetical protein
MRRTTAVQQAGEIRLASRDPVTAVATMFSIRR